MGWSHEVKAAVANMIVGKPNFVIGLARDHQNDCVGITAKNLGFLQPATGGIAKFMNMKMFTQWPHSF